MSDGDLWGEISTCYVMLSFHVLALRPIYADLWELIL